MNIEQIQKIITGTYASDEYPVLCDQIASWQNTQPLKGLTVLDATPVFRNTMAKYLALIAAGAELVVGISEVMPYDSKIIKILTQSGIKIVKAESVQTIKIDFILDCAASFIKWHAELGYVELTRSGIDSYKAANKAVYLADSGVIKKIETSLGTGESFFRAMRQLGYNDFENKNLVIYGSGKVGRGLEIYAKKYGMNVAIISKDEGDYIDANDREKIDETLKSAYAVVTATGVKGAVEKSCDCEKLINSSALLANMGVEDEFGESIPNERVLEGKKPLNFILEEPTHMKYIDATMALHNWGAIYLKDNPEIKNVVSPDSETEKKFLNITASKGLITSEIDSI
ncbi:MAG: hypothetical protein R3Y38_03655 [Rikenellaceae bacterium]